MNDRTVYNAYGLVIRSDVPLPELLPYSGGLVPDVEVRLGTVHQKPAPDAPQGCYLASPDEACFAWEAYGRYLIRRGREIVIDAGSITDELSPSLVVTGIGLGVLLHQRGSLTFHASAVRLPQGAVAFVGVKGAGKSTTAATLNAAGFPLITDDVLSVVERGPTSYDVQPGFPRLKLWPDASEGVLGASASGHLVRPGFPKHTHRVERDFDPKSIPLVAMFVLEDAPDYSLERLPARDAVLALTSHSYALRFLGEAGVSSEHFHRCVALSKHVPIYVLKRPRALDQVQDLARFITEHAPGLGTPPE